MEPQIEERAPGRTGLSALRVPFRRAPDPQRDEARMTVTEHLEALRRVLIVAVLAWALGSALAFAFNRAIFDFLVAPGRGLLPQGGLVYLNPTGGFNLSLKVAAFGGFVIALPVILGAAWTFVRPGLLGPERRAALPLLVSSLLLFAAGAALAYHMLPIALRFLMGFGGGDLHYLPSAGDYIDFVATLLLVFGLTFELPVALVILALAGVINHRRLASIRLYAWIAIIVVAMVVTPGTDPFTPILLAVPLLLLYEGSILVIRLIRR